MASIDDAYEQVADDEIVYRTVSDRSGWYDPDSDSPIAWETFRPNKRDLDGLSVWRAKYKSPEQAALQHARQDRRYYVVAMRVGDLRRIGVEVAATSAADEPGHASLTTLSTATYREEKNRIRGLAQRIATELVDTVHGPFGPILGDRYD